jgi:hypothetical protein
MAIQCTVPCSGDHHKLSLRYDGTITVDPQFHDEELEDALIALGADEPECLRLQKYFQQKPLDFVDCVININKTTGAPSGTPFAKRYAGAAPDTNQPNQWLKTWLSLDFAKHILWIFKEMPAQESFAKAIESAYQHVPFTPRTRNEGFWIGQLQRFVSLWGEFGSKQTVLFMAATAIEQPLAAAISNFTMSQAHDSFQRAAIAVGLMKGPRGIKFRLPEGQRYGPYMMAHPEIMAAFRKERQWQLSRIHEVLLDIELGEQVYPHWKPAP